MLIVVFATRDTTTDQELSLKITELRAEISDLRAEMSAHINSKPVVKFEATRDSNETITYVCYEL